MGWLKSLFRGEKKMTSWELFRQIYGDRKSSSGTSVTVASSLETATVFAICRVLADGVGQVPCKLFQKDKANRIEVYDHPLSELLTVQPNGFQTAFEFFETMIFHLTLTGNAFVFVNRVGSKKRIAELLLLLPGSVTVRRMADQSLEYEYTTEDGKKRVFPAETIWHLRGPSWNSWYGLDPVKMARNAIGLGMALEEAHAGMHKNGAKTSGLISIDKTISQEKYKELAAWLDMYEIGGERYQKAMILDSGAEFTPFTMTGVDSQHLETRKFQIEEMCRPFRVLPIMIGHSDKTTAYASSEQMFLAHVVHTLTPWYVRIEQSARVNLLSEDERKAGMYFKFMPNALMRGSAEARSTYFAKALGAGGTKGWMTQNDVRAAEDMERIEDPEADKLPQPVQSTAASSVQPQA